MAAEATTLECKWTGCSEVFDDAEPLFSHVCETHVGRAVNGNLCLVCSWGECRKPTTKRDNITSHIRTHIPLRSYGCEFCDKAFKRGVDLKKHLKTHNNESAEAQLKSESGQHPEPTTPATTKSNAQTPSSRPKRTPVKSKKAIESESVEAERSRGRPTRTSSVRQGQKVDEAIRQEVQQRLAAETASPVQPAAPTPVPPRRGRRASQKVQAAEKTADSPTAKQQSIAPAPATTKFPVAPQISTVHPLAQVAPILPYNSEQHYQPPTPIADSIQIAPVAPMMPTPVEDTKPPRGIHSALSVNTSAQRSMTEIGESSKTVVQQIGRDIAELILQTEGEAAGMADKLEQLSKTTSLASSIIEEIAQKHLQFADVSDSLPRTLAVNGIERIMKILMTLVDNYGQKDDKAWDELRKSMGDTKDAIFSSFLSIAVLLPGRPSESPVATRAASAEKADAKPKRRKYTSGMYEEDNTRTKRRRATLPAAEDEAKAAQ